MTKSRTSRNHQSSSASRASFNIERDIPVLGALFGGSFSASGASDDELLILGKRVAITANVDIIGDVTVKGNVTVTSGDVMADGISLKQHTHPQNSGNHFGGGANTSPPNG